MCDHLQRGCKGVRSVMLEYECECDRCGGCVLLSMGEGGTSEHIGLVGGLVGRPAFLWPLDVLLVAALRWSGLV
jgi:hypothetical protein